MDIANEHHSHSFREIVKLAAASIDVTDIAKILVFSFIMLLIGMVLLPEPNLSLIAGLITMAAWTNSFTLWGVIALQKDQLEIQEQQLASSNMTTKTSTEKASKEQDLAAQKLALDREKLDTQKEILSQFKEMVSIQKEMLSTHNELVAHEKRVLNFQQYAQHEGKVLVKGVQEVFQTALAREVDKIVSALYKS